MGLNSSTVLHVFSHTSLIPSTHKHTQFIQYCLVFEKIFGKSDRNSLLVNLSLHLLIDPYASFVFLLTLSHVGWETFFFVNLLCIVLSTQGLCC